MARRSTGIHERTTVGGEEVTLVKAGVLVEATGHRRDPSGEIHWRLGEAAGALGVDRVRQLPEERHPALRCSAAATGRCSRPWPRSTCSRDV